MIKVETFVFNPFGENTYLVYDDLLNEGFIVDPGCLEKEEYNELKEFIKIKNIKIIYILVTHGHLDHIFGVKRIKQYYNAGYYYPKNELHFYDIMQSEAMKYGISYEIPPKPDYFYDENNVIKCCETDIRFLSTPGHSPDSYCIYLEKENLCFTGDVLFNESIGRTDLWGGNYEKLITSIKSKLFTLPDDTIIYPGHGDKTTIGYEKTNNPFLKV